MDWKYLAVSKGNRLPFRPGSWEPWPGDEGTGVGPGVHAAEMETGSTHEMHKHATTQVRRTGKARRKQWKRKDRTRACGPRERTQRSSQEEVEGGTGMRSR